MMLFTPDTAFLAKGHEFRDEQGRLVATLARDVFIGEVVRPSMFVWPGEPPVGGMIIDPAIRKHVAIRSRELGVA